MSSQIVFSVYYKIFSSSEEEGTHSGYQKIFFAQIAAYNVSLIVFEPDFTYVCKKSKYREKNMSEKMTSFNN